MTLEQKEKGQLGFDFDTVSGVVLGASGNGNGTGDARIEETLEALMEAGHQSKYLIVMLGRRPEVMQRVANQMQHVIDSGQLAAALPSYGSNTKVLVAADAVHALQLWQEHGYHQVPTIFVNPQDETGKELVIIQNFLDRNLLTEINRQPILTETGVVDERAVAQQIYLSLSHHLAVIEQVKAQHAKPEDELQVLPSGMLPPERIGRYNERLEEIIRTEATTALRDQWNARIGEEVTNTKRTQKASQTAAYQPKSSPTAEEAQAAVRALTQFPFTPINEADYGKKTGPTATDSRRASPELGKLVEAVLASAAFGQVPEATHFYQHATRGIIGMFPPDAQTSDLEEKFLFVKPYSSETEVEELFRNFKRLRERGIFVTHEPLAYHPFPEMRELGVVSRSPLLAITAKVAEQVSQLGKQLGQPSVEEAYLEALMNINLELLLRYRSVAETTVSEQDMVRALHKYKLTLRTAAEDMQLANGVALSDLESRTFLTSLGAIFDDLSYWNPKLFGPIQDNKTYNHGNKLGTVEPTPELVRDVLFKGALKPDGAVNGTAGKRAIEANMRATYGILEYVGRLGVVLEDYFHTVNSPDLNIPPADRQGHFETFIHGLMPEATEKDLSGIWPAYFGIEFYKALRKMQRTVHYAITNAGRVEDSTRANAHRLYMSEYHAYSAWLAQTAFAATTLLAQHAEDPFQRQLEVLGQLYAERQPHFPSHPETLPQLPRAICGAYLAVQRLVDEQPRAARHLRSLAVVR